MAFQPQIRLPDKRLRGVEALARWHSLSRGPVSPRQFIPVAEKAGLICRLGQLVLESACHAAASWQFGSEFPPCLIAVNVSSIQFTESGFFEQVQKALDRSRFAPGCLELEITETTILQEKVKAVRTLHALREMGVQIAIDDFCTGQSCLAILQDLPVDTVPKDR
ncbi:MAG: EAL domain-containing protein [Desulfovermiculus sp.]